MVSGVCTDASIAGADLGPCDRSCTTGLCADGRCLDARVCSTLCPSRGCPTVTVGNQELTPIGMGCSYVVDGCFGGAPLAFGAPSAVVPAGCFAGALSSVGWLTGDCDHDGRER